MLWWGRWDLNPGSHAPQACILIQSRDLALRIRTKSLLDDGPTKQTENTDKIINTLLAMQNNGKAENTLRQVSYSLAHLNRNTNINKPEEVKAYIATLKTKKGRAAEPATRNKLVFAYFNYCETNNIPFDKPHFKVEESIPIIPTTENVTKILSGATTRFAPIFTILTETGIEGKELERIPRKQIDAEQGIISVKGCKGYESGTYKLKEATTDMLRLYLIKNHQDYPFPKSNVIGKSWRDTRRIVANRLSQPELNNIPLRNLRNYAGAKLWYATQDPIAVMRLTSQLEPAPPIACSQLKLGVACAPPRTFQTMTTDFFSLVYAARRTLIEQTSHLSATFKLLDCLIPNV